MSVNVNPNTVTFCNHNEGQIGTEPLLNLIQTLFDTNSRRRSGKECFKRF